MPGYNLRSRYVGAAFQETTDDKAQGLSAQQSFMLGRRKKVKKGTAKDWDRVLAKPETPSLRKKSQAAQCQTRMKLIKGVFHSMVVPQLDVSKLTEQITRLQLDLPDAVGGRNTPTITTQDGNSMNLAGGANWQHNGSADDSMSFLAPQTSTHTYSPMVHSPYTPALLAPQLLQAYHVPVVVEAAQEPLPAFAPLINVFRHPPPPSCPPPLTPAPPPWTPWQPTPVHGPAPPGPLSNLAAALKAALPETSQPSPAPKPAPKPPTLRVEDPKPSAAPAKVFEVIDLTSPTPTKDHSTVADQAGRRLRDRVGSRLQTGTTQPQALRLQQPSDTKAQGTGRAAAAAASKLQQPSDTKARDTARAVAVAADSTGVKSGAAALAAPSRAAAPTAKGALAAAPNAVTVPPPPPSSAQAGKFTAAPTAVAAPPPPPPPPSAQAEKLTAAASAATSRPPSKAESATTAPKADTAPAPQPTKVEPAAAPPKAGRKKEAQPKPAPAQHALLLAAASQALAHVPEEVVAQQAAKAPKATRAAAKAAIVAAPPEAPLVADATAKAQAAAQAVPGCGADSRAKKPANAEPKTLPSAAGGEAPQSAAAPPAPAAPPPPRPPPPPPPCDFRAALLKPSPGCAKGRRGGLKGRAQAQKARSGASAQADGGTASAPTAAGGPASSAAEAGYTVFDTNVLVHFLDVVEQWIEVAAKTAGALVMLLLPKAVIQELDGLKRNPLVGEQSRRAMVVVERAQRQGLVRAQREDEVAVPEGLQQIAASLLPTSGVGKREIQEWLQSQVSSLMRGDDSILGCLRFFATAGTQLLLCSEDRIMRVRVRSHAIPAMQPGELRRHLAAGTVPRPPFPDPIDQEEPQPYRQALLGQPASFEAAQRSDATGRSSTAQVAAGATPQHQATSAWQPHPFAVPSAYCAAAANSQRQQGGRGAARAAATMLGAYTPGPDGVQAASQATGYPGYLAARPSYPPQQPNPVYPAARGSHASYPTFHAVQPPAQLSGHSYHAGQPHQGYGAAPQGAPSGWAQAVHSGGQPNVPPGFGLCHGGGHHGLPPGFGLSHPQAGPGATTGSNPCAWPNTQHGSRQQAVQQHNVPSTVPFPHR